jgi:transaldolase
MNKLVELTRLGQSIWYDNIERGLLKNGELSRLITEDSITGVTSNPSIFEKAITSSTDYDEDIKSLAKQGVTTEEIYETITVQDIISACDLLQAVYRKSNGSDGYVSIEVPPDYGYDTTKTIESARRIFKTINCPNILIKVPGTKEGFTAVKQLISEGININITLLFSLEQYKSAAHFYIEGLKERLRAGLSLNNIFSVASVFVSRIDTTVDKMINERGKMKDIRGRTAVANAKVIYQIYRMIFDSSDFRELLNKRANKQKIVWASTSTKNPAYFDTLYVDELIAPETINTIPTATLFAFKDHGKPQITIEKNLEQSEQLLKSLADAGINMEQVCEEILSDGVKMFKDSYDKALKAIENKSLRKVKKSREVRCC